MDHQKEKEKKKNKTKAAHADETDLIFCNLCDKLQLRLGSLLQYK